MASTSRPCARSRGPPQAAADRFLAGSHAALDDFRGQHPWLADAALFRALHDAHHGLPWWTWPAALRDRDPKALARAVDENRLQIQRFEAIQYFFDRQWAALRAACADRGVGFIGDLPIYVDADSADVWAHRHLFEVDAAGQRTRVAGVPPDGFSATGQLWGNPLYRWQASAAEDHAWWRARLGRALGLTDRVRIDHFRAFSAYWAVPADAPDARTGAWEPGPGQAFFDRMSQAFGPELPVIAEDLGVIDDGVKALLASSGLPGMHVLQFAFGGEADNWYLPHNHRKNGVVYPGTHDNDTTLGWWLAAEPHVQDHVRRYFGVSGHDLVWDVIRAALASVCDTAILAAQDTLALDGSARMNTPAQGLGNWSWRLWPGQLGDAGRLRDLNGLYGRI
ncbi:MAG: 4-alpha-glucanotransferase [bacterium]